MKSGFRIEALASSHDRAGFSCGVEPLDRYLKTQASQDVRRRVSNCFVAVPEGAAAIAGFYTLAAASIPVLDLPEEQTRRLPRYPVLPAALIGRLAVDEGFRGKQLGAALLFDALLRALRADPAVLTVIVDAKDAKAKAFYQHHGFQPFRDLPSRLFLPVDTAAKLLR
ncbi:GCN5-related N-acetyltransferase; Histone acetyltransferase HPA2 and related acetyltransferases [Hyphomicrobiales bacterium]|nr:GCN5-related N-acetyltransferase; Histone acetyltransferase HPA2 and related acetyltransferases [Hyphomicrobiales bacterium]CAH1698707.1 GCN5-related N-acetyltransferase; Histone acetyltransferase HPA2 and related acetyltransferases [Hyphomicrobiales bacterium]